MPKSVLLLDDDTDLITILSMAVVTIIGGNTVEAHSFKELQTLANRALACDIAFLDINLGPNEPNGLDALRWLKKEGYSGQIYFFTGHASNHPLVHEAITEFPEAAILSKPLDFAELEKVLKA